MSSNMESGARHGLEDSHRDRISTSTWDPVPARHERPDQRRHASAHHDRLVTDIATKVKDFHARHVPFRIYHGSTNSTRKLEFSRDAIIDTSSLEGILAVDPVKRTALVEPNVRMDALVKATIAHGLIPPVVPELPSITVGGAFAGTAGESSSFKHGFFDATVNWCKVVLGNGEVVGASNEENADLFDGSKGAMGTLGVITLFEIRLEPTTGWVRVHYMPVGGSKSMMEGVQAMIVQHEKYDFVEGITFSQEQGLVIVGTLTGAEPEDNYPKKTFLRTRDDWFYLHAQKVRRKMTDQSKPFTEMVPIEDYVFRYDRGGFWSAKYAYPMFYTPFNRLTRTALDPLMKTERMYRALHHSGMSQRFVIQDVAIPLTALAGFLDWVNKEFDINPLWICPLRSDSTAIFQKGRGEQGPDIPFVNIGVWGPCSDKRYLTGKDWFTRFISDNRMLEQKVVMLGGLKCLYAHQYFTKDEFWDLFDKSEYDKLRRRWHADGLPDVYEKVKPRSQPGPVQPIRGVLRMLLRRNHILTPIKSRPNSRKPNAVSGGDQRESAVKTASDKSSDSSDGLNT